MMPLQTINMTGKPSTGGESDIKPTAEELRVIQERMKDPKFVELMGEYMQSLADPKTRAEEEAYLEQAEREAREGGDFTFDFIFPRPVFVVELGKPSTTTALRADLQKLTGSNGQSNKTSVRSYINFCISDKVDVYTENPTGDAQGSQWHVPVSVCAKRLEYLFENRQTPKKFREGEDETVIRKAYEETQSAAAKASVSPSGSTPLCYVYDAVFHPRTLSLADRSNRFLCFLVEIAIEHINAGYSESNGFEFSRLSSDIVCVGYPKNQTIRKKGSESPFAVDPSAPVLTKPTKNINEEQRKAEAPSASAGNKGATRSCETKKETATNKTVSTSAAQVSSLPPFTIKHRGGIDMSDAWVDHRLYDKKIGVPEFLVVTIDFSKLPKPNAAAIQASSIDIAVVPEGTALMLQKTNGQPYFEGLLVLPFSVEDEPTSAKFDKNQRVLTLELRVHEHLRKRLLSKPSGELADKSSAVEDVSPSLNQAEAETSIENHVNPNGALNDNAPANGRGAAKESPTTSACSPKENESRSELFVPQENGDKFSTLSSEAATSVPPTPPVPANDRFQQMRAKVEEARRAREAALIAIAEKEKEIEQQEREAEEAAVAVKEAVEQLQAPPSLEEAMKAQTEEKEATDSASATASSQLQNEPVFLQAKESSKATVADDLFNIGKQQQQQELDELEKRQNSWVSSIQEAIDAEDVKEMEAATKRARKEAEKAKKQYEAALAREKLEKKAHAERNAVPLLNQHIFSID